MASGNSSSTYNYSVRTSQITRCNSTRQERREADKMATMRKMESMLSEQLRDINRTYVELRIIQPVHFNLIISCGFIERKVNVVSTSRSYLRRISQSRAFWQYLRLIKNVFGGRNCRHRRHYIYGLRDILNVPPGYCAFLGTFCCTFSAILTA